MSDFTEWMKTYGWAILVILIVIGGFVYYKGKDYIPVGKWTCVEWDVEGTRVTIVDIIIDQRNVNDTEWTLWESIEGNYPCTLKALLKED